MILNPAAADCLPWPPLKAATNFSRTGEKPPSGGTIAVGRTAVPTFGGRPLHVRAIRHELRHFAAAAVDHVGAAGVEAAARRRIERARDLSLQHNPAALCPRFRHRDRGQQRAAVGMARFREQRVRRRRLDDLAEIHHGDAVGDVLDHGEIVRDEDVGQPKPVLQLAQQVEDLRADRDVERRDRLVADDQFRLDRERAGDGDALALAAGEFVRIAPRRAAARARPAAGSPRRARAAAPAAPDRAAPAARPGSGRPSCAD